MIHVNRINAKTETAKWLEARPFVNAIKDMSAHIVCVSFYDVDLWYRLASRDALVKFRALVTILWRSGFLYMILYCDPNSLNLYHQRPKILWTVEVMVWCFVLLALNSANLTKFWMPLSMSLRTSDPLHRRYCGHEQITNSVILSHNLNILYLTNNPTGNLSIIN